MMTHYGKITHFDQNTGTGMISPPTAAALCRSWRPACGRSRAPTGPVPVRPKTTPMAACKRST